MLLVLFLGILLLSFFYLVGSLFLHNALKAEASFLQQVVNFWVGLLVVVSMYAQFKTTFVSVLILIPVILFSFKRYFVIESGERKLSGFKFILISAGVYALLYFLQVNFNVKFLTDPVPYMSYIHPREDERHIYSTIISFLHYEGVETISSESILHGTSGLSLYHFIEFWLGSFFKLFFNVKSDIALFYFVYPVFKTFTVLAICSILSDKITTRVDFLLVAGFAFCFIILGLKMIFPPVYKMTIRDILFVPIIALACKAIFLKKYEASMALLMIASVENILFLPALVIFLVVFYGKYNRYSLLKGILFLLIYVVFFYLFKEKVNDKYFSLGLKDAVDLVFSFKTLHQGYRTLLAAVLSFPMRLLLCFLVLNWYSKVKLEDPNLRFACWIALCFFAYHLAFSLMDDLSIDANQLQILANILISVSFLFVVRYFIGNRQLVVCVILLLLLSDYTYPFGKVEVPAGYDSALEKKLEEVGKGRILKGLYVDENQVLKDQWYLKYYPVYFTEYARGNDYRMYLFNYDITDLRSSIGGLGQKYKPILYKVIQPNFSLDTNVLSNIDKYNISLVWIRKDSKYLDAFRDKRIFHELQDYYIYYIKK